MIRGMGWDGIERMGYMVFVSAIVVGVGGLVVVVMTMLPHRLTGG